VNDYLALIAGIACAGFGGELFVRGSVGIAAWMRISPGIVGATVAAFATSSPEFAVSMKAALDGSPRIALGDALGSNLVNVALVLGIALAISEIRCPRHGLKLDYPVALAVPIVTGALCLDGQISRLEGVLMLGMFATWLFSTVVQARKQRSAAEEVLADRQSGQAFIHSVAGLLLLTMAGNLIVIGARGIAASFGIDEFVVGATVVAVGTSVPELATAIISKLRGHDEVGLGAVLGSNIFNGLLIIPVAAMISPIEVDLLEVLKTLGFGMIAVLAAFPDRNGLIPRARCVVLFALYGAFSARLI
jgi:cation:H+ antiporter